MINKSARVFVSFLVLILIDGVDCILIGDILHSKINCQTIENTCIVSFRRPHRLVSEVCDVAVEPDLFPEDADHVGREQGVDVGVARPLAVRAWNRVFFK